MRPSVHAMKYLLATAAVLALTACGQQCLRSDICATRSKGPAAARSDTDHTGRFMAMVTHVYLVLHLQCHIHTTRLQHLYQPID
jgi:hypothetical protein